MHRNDPSLLDTLSSEDRPLDTFEHFALALAVGLAAVAILQTLS